jgi:hypothetical protein
VSFHPNLKDPQSCQSIQGKRRRAFDGRTSDDIPRALRRRRSKSKIQEWMTASETASQTGQINQHHIWGSSEFRTRRCNCICSAQMASHATELAYLGPNPLDPGHLSDVALNQQAGREKIDFALAPRRPYCVGHHRAPPTKRLFGAHC